MSNFCESCGKALNPGAKFCGKCGSGILSDSSSANVPQNVKLPPRIIMEKRKPGFFASIFGLGFVLIGGFGILLSIISALTIVGIPIAILMALGAGVLFAGGVYMLGGAKTVCPICGKTILVMPGADNAKCPKCKNLAIIDWTK